MCYLIVCKCVEGKGVVGIGIEYYWYMIVSVIGLVLIVLFFFYIFGSIFGGLYEEVIVIFLCFVFVVLIVLVLVFGLQYYFKGFQIMVEDYWCGIIKKVVIIFMIVFVYGLMVFGFYVLVKMVF